MKQFTDYPGVGVKTAACVILFCLRQCGYAYRQVLSGWARLLRRPLRTTYLATSTWCPDHLKYGLHQLFIRHGQTCGKCKRSTAEAPPPAITFRLAPAPLFSPLGPLCLQNALHGKKKPAGAKLLQG
ncbi:hypothetical protein F5X99DRAFT_412434 [Biscogniauxia marginata]|nr:hypothetical protein F5X99DRAFT_412434 [Biscogniauxia marginata]